jgi:hypothetical protein
VGRGSIRQITDQTSPENRIRDVFERHKMAAGFRDGYSVLQAMEIRSSLCDANWGRAPARLFLSETVQSSLAEISGAIIQPTRCKAWQRVGDVKSLPAETVCERSAI